MLKSMKIANYKNIGNKYIGFEQLTKLNVLIGQNNIGKSTLLEMIDFLFEMQINYNRNLMTETMVPPMEFTVEVDKNLPMTIFGKDTSSSDIGNHYEYGSSFIGRKITYRTNNRNLEAISYVTLDDDEPVMLKNTTRGLELLNNFGSYCLNELINQHNLIKLYADRNLIPEIHDDNLIVESDGRGGTNLIRHYLHNSHSDHRLVEVTLLEALNKIIGPQDSFSRIMCQEQRRNSEIYWEVLLENKNGKIALSNSGSGLRTILLVLIKLFLEPKANGFGKQKNIYIFEELENNLHPAIQRNLFNYLFEWIKNHDDIIFLTTHSNIPLNMSYGNSDVSITHLKKDLKTGELITEIGGSFLNNNDILNDLGVKASDILQSNSIIWVEGPSDRVYINKWIELESKGALKENIHYQIIFYGGRLLSQLSGDIDEDVNNLIQLFRANRNSIIVMDSDRTSKGKKINKTKQRIKEEFEKQNSIAWITKGKEIENYLSKSTLKKAYGYDITIGQFDIIIDVLNKIQDKKRFGDIYGQYKYRESINLVQNMDRKDLDVLDLHKNIREIVNKIKVWNGLI